MSRVTELTIGKVERIAFRLAQEKLTYKEPIPEFSSRYPQKLESCLCVPFQKFSGKDLYPGLLSKAAMLFYLLIKDHPFQNGNKRIAMTCLMFFLYENGKWIESDPKELYNFAMWVASSPADAKADVLSFIEKFVKKYAVKLEED